MLMRDPINETCNHVSTQADICGYEPVTYESEDEGSSRRNYFSRRNKIDTSTYSKEDIKEQYCINDKQLSVLEHVHESSSFFGCLSSYQDSSCRTRSPSLLSVCVRRRVPSDENLHDLCRQPPIPRWPRRFVHLPAYPHYHYPPFQDCTFFAHKPPSLYSDPNYYWVTDEEIIRMERPVHSVCSEDFSGSGYDSYPRRSKRKPHFMSYSSEYLHGGGSAGGGGVRLESCTPCPPCPAHSPLPPPPPPPPPLPPSQPIVQPPRQKHVSFARSPTLTSFEDLSSTAITNNTTCSQERLIDCKKLDSPKDSPKTIVSEKIKRAPMKTQATQTEACLGRKPRPASHLMLSPRLVQRVHMVSQGAQTNGQLNGDRGVGRRLLKSYSEVGGRFSLTESKQELHEPLQRTQSEEPPKSPYTMDDDTMGPEIFIDFEPQETRRRRGLEKTLSEGQILGEKPSKPERETTMSDGEFRYEETETETETDPELEPETGVGSRLGPDRVLEEVAHKLETSPSNSSNLDQDQSVSSAPTKRLMMADSLEEEFHENLIYGGLFMKREVSSGDRERLEELELEMEPDKLSPAATGSGVTGGLKASSPFVSSDSLKDHSDSIWNESQTTVLHDSDNNGGCTNVSLSDISSSLTPATRRRHRLILQHQQRSSIDTEALETEDFELESKVCQPVSTCIQPVVPSVAVTTPTYAHTLSSVSSSVHSKRPKDQGSTSKRKSVQTPKASDGDQQTPLSRSSSSELLDRVEQSRTNDVSETSTVTEEYATATENNSATPSGRASLTGPVSSVESASSKHSLSHDDGFKDQQQGSHQLPSAIAEEKPSLEDSKRCKSPDAESSSSGSYSIEGVSSEEKCMSDHCYSAADESEQQSPKGWPEEDGRRSRKALKVRPSPHGEQEVPKSSRPQTFSFQYRSGVPNEENADPPQIAKTSPEDSIHKRAIIGNGVEDHSSDESASECACGRRRFSRRKTNCSRSPLSHTRPKKRQQGLPKTVSLVADGNRSVPRIKTPTALSPGHGTSKSLGDSPTSLHTDKDSISLASAASIESIRLSSPRSADSVFYSPEHHSCHHCGKQIDSQTPDTNFCQTKVKSKSAEMDIVKPPAGFADSPQSHQRLTFQTRLFKKNEKTRFRSEERCFNKRHRAEKTRAKSEERVKEKSTEKQSLTTRSTDASIEELRLSPFGDSKEELSGVYKGLYCESSWVFVSDTSEFPAFQKADSRDEDDQKEPDRVNYTEAFESEREFRKKYQGITQRMFHRKASLEMYKRMASAKKVESDKKLLVKRISTGEFGFRIHGSRPVVVSAIEPNTPAETSGLEVGDVILSINKTCVLDATHSEVVSLAHSGSDTLEIEVAVMPKNCDTIEIVKSGPLWKLTTLQSNKELTWILRFFSLKEDNCLYFYKTDSDTVPSGAIRLTGYHISRAPDSGHLFSFHLTRPGSLTYQLAAENQEETESWLTVLQQATCQQMKSLVDHENMLKPPSAILDPDCDGYLTVLLHLRQKIWKKKYVLLKNAFLFFFRHINSDTAFALASLHGYRVQCSNTVKQKFLFELIPPDCCYKHFHFYTDNEIDRKRWITALEFSIDRWIKVG
ncbi:unnamed protein product [Bemisia tabaci]|uniref:Uncharacterized protein n=2 Tax=Bemisia tabaci TaxID=7038 RepID=A0A9P0F3A4_BEMTA|nr:unnamed protein product [Bemisia tabaci]